MSESLGKAVLELGTDNKGLYSGLAAARTASLKSVISTAKASKAAMVGVMAGVAVAIGVGLFKVGREFEDAFNTIRVGTGATGDDLEGLKDDFKAVVRDVPTDFDTASTAIADLNTRLGLTGPELQERAKQFLELSRITGTDVESNIRKVSKAFMDWEVPVEKQAKTLDGFFRVSQATGIGVDELAGRVQEFGSPLRQLGFSLEESAAMFGTFEKAGVNTSTMVPGLKMAISNLTRPTSTLEKSMRKLGIATGDPEKALKQVMGVMNDEGIPTTEKIGLAMDVFGRRAGADMAEAIKQGRFSLDDMVKVFEDGSDTIIGAGKETQTFSDKLTILKNRGMVALEPAATAVVGVMMKLADALIVASDAVGKIPGPVKTLVLALVAGGGLAFAIAKVVAAFKVLKLAMMANPYLAVIAATVAVAILVVKHWDKIKAAIDAVWKWLKNAARNTWNAIKSTVDTVARAIASVIRTYFNTYRSIINGAWNAVKTVTRSAWNAVKSVVSTAIGAVVGFVRALPGRAVAALSSLVSRLASAARSGFQGLRTGASEKIGSLLELVRGIPSRIVSAIGGLGGLLVGAGRAVIQGFINGIEQMLGALWSKVSGIANKIKSLKGPLPKDRVLLVDEGRAIIEGLGRGLDTEFRRLQSDIAGYAPTIQATFAGAAGAGSPFGPSIGGDGPLVNIENLEVRDAFDEAKLASDLAWRLQT